MKQRHSVSGKTIQVADKGLNCARNIYAAVKEANDGYIFSKSIHGKNLSEKGKNGFYLRMIQMSFLITLMKEVIYLFVLNHVLTALTTALKR